MRKNWKNLCAKNMGNISNEEDEDDREEDPLAKAVGIDGFDAGYEAAQKDLADGR